MKNLYLKKTKGIYKRKSKLPNNFDEKIKQEWSNILKN